VQEIADQLDAYGVGNLAGDRDGLGEIVSDPSGWGWATGDCPYAVKTISAWAGAKPRRGRHPWLIDCATRLAAMHRWGCLTGPLHRRAVETLTRRMAELCEQGIGGQVRSLAPGEIADALTWGAAKAASKADEALRAELGAATGRHRRHQQAEPNASNGSHGSNGPTSVMATVDGAVEPPEDGAALLDEVRRWLGRFVSTMTGDDLNLLTLWAAHTWVVEDLYTTPRLQLDSPVEESGKTTTLEHLNRLCRRGLLMSTISSPALLVRVLDQEMRTLLIDEADRTLRPNKPETADLIAVLNSGYKRGASRPVLVPVAGGGWEVQEMPTFAPVVIAGNNPDLPSDTVSRILRVILMPALEGEVEETNWEEIEDDACALGLRLGRWARASHVRTYVREFRPQLPDEVRSRARERWSPLARIAAAAGGRWPAVVTHLAVQDVERIKIEKEDSIVQQKPGVALLHHIREVWPEGERFLRTERLIDRLIGFHPEMWGSSSPYGKPLNPQRLGRMLVRGYGIRTVQRPDGDRSRGYRLADLNPAFRRFCLGEISLADRQGGPFKPFEPFEPPAHEQIEIDDTGITDAEWQQALNDYRGGRS
jgi:hypothetical protein